MHYPSLVALRQTPERELPKLLTPGFETLPENEEFLSAWRAVLFDPAGHLVNIPRKSHRHTRVRSNADPDTLLAAEYSSLLSDENAHLTEDGSVTLGVITPEIEMTISTNTTEIRRSPICETPFDRLVLDYFWRHYETTQISQLVRR